MCFFVGLARAREAHHPESVLPRLCFGSGASLLERLRTNSLLSGESWSASLGFGQEAGLSGATAADEGTPAAAGPPVGVAAAAEVRDAISVSASCCAINLSLINI